MIVMILNNGIVLDCEGLILKELETAIRLRKEGKLKESNQILINLVSKYPEDAMIN